MTCSGSTPVSASSRRWGGDARCFTMTRDCPGCDRLPTCRTWRARSIIRGPVCSRARICRSAAAPRSRFTWAGSCGAQFSRAAPRTRSGGRGTGHSRCFGGCAPSTCSIETFVAPRYLPPAMNVIPQNVRDGFGKLIDPLALVFIRLHVRPNLITTIGTLVVIASSTAFGVGWVRLGGLLLLVSGIFDLLDGRVARRGDMTTTFGAFYDSTLDRVGESALFGGSALYCLRG